MKLQRWDGRGRGRGRVRGWVVRRKWREGEGERSNIEGGDRGGWKRERDPREWRQGEKEREEDKMRRERGIYEREERKGEGRVGSGGKLRDT